MKICLAKKIDHPPPSYTNARGEGGHGAKKVIWPIFSPFQTNSRIIFLAKFPLPPHPPSTYQGVGHTAKKSDLTNFPAISDHF